MPFKKVYDGLIESENYYNFETISSMLTSSQWINTNGSFRLISGTVERLFDFKNFMIHIEKSDNFLLPSNKIQFYIDGSSGKWAIEESAGATAKAWQLVYIDGYLQAYQTSDLTNWDNIGGTAYNSLQKQGFSVFGTQPLTVTKYKIYKNPFVAIQGYNIGIIAKLYNYNNVLQGESIFDNSGQCKIFMHNEFLGKLKLYENDVLIFESDEVEFKPGDTWENFPYELEVIYNDNIIDWHIANFDGLHDYVKIKNVSLETYINLPINILSESEEIIQISFDDVNFFDNLIIESINPDEEKTIYINIEKTYNVEYGTKAFELIIGG